MNELINAVKFLVSILGELNLNVSILTNGDIKICTVVKNPVATAVKEKV
jgi:hypothetical protein